MTEVVTVCDEQTEPGGTGADATGAHHRRTRRGVLQMASVGGAGLLAAACRPATPTATTDPAAVPSPTAPPPTAPPPTAPPPTAPPPTAPPPTAPPTTVPTLPPLPSGFADPAGLHAARRLTWGATPALAEDIRARGLPTWLDEQLGWQSIDDSAVGPMLAPWPRPGWTAAQVRADEEWRVPWEMAVHEMLRRAFCRAQLHEVLVDFWWDHFNVDGANTPARWHMPTMDRDVIRPHALGRFADLLMGVATSGAMLLYLDQAGSRADGGRTPNENYARELMELHTVGSDGGYTNDDVAAVAHLLSGWSLTAEDGTFTFRSAWHADGPFTPSRPVLGFTRGALSGEAACRALVDHLAHHPTTARRICHKLAVRLIGEHVGRSDAVVTAAATAFTDADTSVAAAVRSLVLSPEFAASANAKVRRPADLATQMARALGLSWVQPANPDDFLWNTWSHLDQMGHAPHGWPTPDGYPDRNAQWLSAGALVSRWNLAVDFTYGGLPGLAYSAEATMAWAPNRRWGEWLDALARAYLGEPWPPAVRASVLAKYSVTDTTVFRNWDHWAAAPIVAVLLQTAAMQRR